MAWDHRYRKLREGEIIQEGDECLTDSHLGWQPPGCTIGHPAPNPSYTAHRIYRRLIDAALNPPPPSPMVTHERAHER